MIFNVHCGKPEPFLINTYLLNIKLVSGVKMYHSVNRKYWLGEAHVNMKNELWEGTQFKEVLRFKDPSVEGFIQQYVPYASRLTVAILCKNHYKMLMTLT